MPNMFSSFHWCCIEPEKLKTFLLSSYIPWPKIGYDSRGRTKNEYRNCASGSIKVLPCCSLVGLLTDGLPFRHTNMIMKE